MSKPVFIVCSESGTQDKQTNLLSLFNIIERIDVQAEVQAPTNGATIVEPLTLRVTAVWRRTEDDSEEDEYESDMVLHSPSPEKQPLTVDLGRFRFGPPEKPLHRFNVVVKAMPFSASGTLRIVSRIRKVGSEAWLTQEYPIPVYVHKEESVKPRENNPGS